MSRVERYEVLIEVAQSTGVEASWLVECVERRLLPAPADASSSELLREVQRLRRLRALGLDTRSLEVVVPMRRRIEALLEQQRMMERELATLRHALAVLGALPSPMLDADVVDEGG